MLYVLLLELARFDIDMITDILAEVLTTHGSTRKTDNCKFFRENLFYIQVEKGWQKLALREIASNAKYDECSWSGFVIGIHGGYHNILPTYAR